jgi:hypothetical protein
MSGQFVLSLDFELHWGVHDSMSLSAYEPNLLGAREVIPKLLERFRQFDIACTWATVGFLFFDSKEELRRNFPDILPQYENRKHSSYEWIERIGNSEAEDPLHFGRSLIAKIRDCPRQEIATQTFSHYYCLEAGQSVESFKADLAAARRAADGLGVDLASIVFPRNQFNAEYLGACREAGLISFRGNEDSWIYRAERHEGLFKRGVRLADTFVNLAGPHIFSPAEALPGLWNVPASQFLLPVSLGLLGRFEGLRVNRIKTAMTAAADADKAFHLWWHPHNFGVNQTENLAFLEAILVHFERLRGRHGMQSMSMQELAAVAGASRGARSAG